MMRVTSRRVLECVVEWRGACASARSSPVPSSGLASGWKAAGSGEQQSLL
jgi:hypothetical protein